MFIVILIFGGVVVLNWALKGGASKLKDLTEKINGPQGQPPGRDADDSEAERTRKFFEALGLPPGSIPPVRTPRPAQPLTLPARPIMPPQPAVIRKKQRPRTVGPRSMPVPARPAAQIRATPTILRPESAAREAALPLASEAAAAVAASGRAIWQTPSAGTTVVPSTASARDELFSLLRSPAQVRNALVLREILGPPRGLQSVIGSHNFPLS